MGQSTISIYFYGYFQSFSIYVNVHQRVMDGDSLSHMVPIDSHPNESTNPRPGNLMVFNGIKIVI